MKPLAIFSRYSLVVLGLVVLSGCASTMSQRQQNAAIGAGVGAVGGAILTGNTLGVLGGAAIGGVIGHGPDRKR